jgi:tetratricopeptide (TPR) repeat protein
MHTRRRLANAHRLIGDYQKAIEEYEQIETFYENDFNVIACMADSYFSLLNIKKAEFYYEKLIKTERDNKDVNYYFHMGMAYLILMDCDNAEIFLKKSIDLGKESKGINLLIEKCKSGTMFNSDQHTMD